MKKEMYGAGGTGGGLSRGARNALKNLNFRNMYTR